MTLWVRLRVWKPLDPINCIVQGTIVLFARSSQIYCIVFVRTIDRLIDQTICPNNWSEQLVPIISLTFDWKLVEQSLIGEQSIEQLANNLSNLLFVELLFYPISDLLVFAGKIRLYCIIFDEHGEQFPIVEKYDPTIEEYDLSIFQTLVILLLV